MDRDKVVKGLECCTSFDSVDQTCMACPYENDCVEKQRNTQLLHDVLALLKEKEPKEVKDKSKRIKFLDEYFEGECPSCRSFLDEHSNRNFCGYCGQEVKWE